MTNELPMTGPISAEVFATAALSALRDVAQDNAAKIVTAAGLIRATIVSGGLLHAFGTGHSQAGALEVAGRAGGLIPTNRVALSDLVVYGGADPGVLDDPLLERDPKIGRRLFDLADIRRGDAVIVISNSGVNGAIVEFAASAMGVGAPLMAIVSTAHSAAVRPAHPSGSRLSDLAAVTFDNGGPVGDALLPTAGGSRACGFSSLSTALIVQMLVAEVVRLMEQDGEEPPIYVSANLPGGHERNVRIEASYQGRLRRRAS